MLVAKTAVYGVCYCKEEHVKEELINGERANNPAVGMESNA